MAAKHIREHMYFNSQPHKEADSADFSNPHGSLYFNSQPHKEADSGIHDEVLQHQAFQLTASQGG